MPRGSGPHMGTTATDGCFRSITTAARGVMDPCGSARMEYDNWWNQYANMDSETVAYRRGRMVALTWGNSGNAACPEMLEQYSYTAWGQLQARRLTLTLGEASGYLELYNSYTADGALNGITGPWQAT